MRLLWILTVLPALLYANADTPTARLASRWSGEARVLNNFTSTRQLPVALNIHPDGTVSGQIGNAQIDTGRIRPRAWWEFRAFNHYEIRIDFTLTGTLTADGLSRKGGRILLIPNGEQLDGWFVSEGFYGFPWSSRATLRARGQLQATDLSLIRH